MLKRLMRGRRGTPERAVPTADLPTQDRLHRYWRSPDDGMNSPEDYLAERSRRSSEFMVEIARRHVSPPAATLEVGCNAGRNLEHLRLAGYGPLTGVEISESAVNLLRRRLPELAAAATIHAGTAEEVLPKLPDDHFGLVLTMAVLVHIHPDSEEIFDQLARVAGGELLIIEDESTNSPRHFKRNYRQVFGERGFRQIEAIPCGEESGLPAFYCARVLSPEP